MLIEYKINGKSIYFDNLQEYCEYFPDEGLFPLDFKFVLTELFNNKIKADKILKDWLLLITRWITEAPYKRFYRDLLKRGFTVLSEDNFFLEDDGTEKINKLEISGIFARYLLRLLFNCNQIISFQMKYP